MSGNVNANLNQFNEWFSKSCGERVCLDLMLFGESCGTCYEIAPLLQTLGEVVLLITMLLRGEGP